LLLQVKPTHVLNAAGLTGRPNVDWCEDHKVCYSVKLLQCQAAKAICAEPSRFAQN